MLKESGGKTYLELYNRSLYEIYEITSINDSSMTWEVTDSLSQLWAENPPPYPLSEHFKMTFKRRVKHPLEDKIIGGFWNVDSTIKVTYDAAGNIIKKEGSSNQNRLFNFEIDIAEIYPPQNEPDADYYEASWILKDREGKTYLEYDSEDYTTMIINQVISVTDDKMVWERKESPTVSYIIELSRQ